MSIDDKQIRNWLSEGKKEKAFRAITGSTSRALYALIRRMARDHMLADDILQNVYMKLFEKIDDFEWRSSLSTYLYRITVNEVLNTLKREKRRETQKIGTVSQAEDPHLDFQTWQQRFEEAVTHLPKQQQAVFILKYYEGKPYKEIAQIMDRSVGTLKANYHHAVKKIREELTKQLI